MPSTYTKRQFQRDQQHAADLANAGNIDGAMLYTHRCVEDFDAAMIEGKWVTAMRRLSYGYEERAENKRAARG